MEKWVTRIKVLVLSAIFASIGNWINTWVTKMRSPTPNKVIIYDPLSVLPALGVMILIILFGYLVQELVAKYLKIKLPSILYISLTAIFLSIPNFSPMATYMKVEFNKIGLLPLCTPILAYAGIAIGKDLEGFKKQGVAIVCTALLTFLGTYLGSALIAEIVLRFTGAI